jgi:hypothetical protein
MPSLYDMRASSDTLLVSREQICFGSAGLLSASVNIMFQLIRFIYIDILALAIVFQMQNADDSNM